MVEELPYNTDSVMCLLLRLFKLIVLDFYNDRSLTSPEREAGPGNAAAEGPCMCQGWHSCKLHMCMSRAYRGNAGI